MSLLQFFHSSIYFFSYCFLYILFALDTKISGGKSGFYKKDELKYHSRKNRGARKITLIKVKLKVILINFLEFRNNVLNSR